MAELTEDQIDDILYFARTNSLSDLEAELTQLATSSSPKISEVEICSAALDPETKNGPMHYAAANGHIEIIKYLLTLHDAVPLKATDSLSSPSTPPVPIINAANKAGNTPLHWAALNGHVEVILLLLSYGADPSILNSAGHDALYEAEVNEKSEAADVLLREGGGLESVVNGQEGGEGEGDEEDETAEEGGFTLSADRDVEGIVEKVEKLDTKS